MSGGIAALPGEGGVGLGQVPAEGGGVVCEVGACLEDAGVELFVSSLAHHSPIIYQRGGKGSHVP